MKLLNPISRRLHGDAGETRRACAVAFRCGISVFLLGLTSIASGQEGEESAPVAREPRRWLWRTFAEFNRQSPLLQIIIVLCALAIGFVLWRSLRSAQETQRWFSPRLFVALTPFLLFSLWCFMEVQFGAYAIRFNMSLGHYDVEGILLDAASSFEFGALISTILVAIHSVAYFLCRRRMRKIRD